MTNRSEWNLKDALDSFRSEPVHEPIARPPEHQTAHPHPSQRWHRVALSLVSLIAVAGWGAYLYEATRTIDSASVRRIGAPEVPVPSPVPPQETIASGVTPSSVAPSVADSKPGPVTPSTPAVVPPTTPPAKPRAESDVPASIPDLSGTWAWTTRLERSGSAAVDGLQLGYELTMEQSGKRITGAGRKVTENGDAIGSGAQTRITIDGTIAGDRLTLAFAERGTERSAEGRLVLLLDESGTLRGRFSTTGAQSSGTVEARRVR
jgi:hypothetical protein